MWYFYTFGKIRFEKELVLWKFVFFVARRWTLTTYIQPVGQYKSRINRHTYLQHKDNIHSWIIWNFYNLYYFNIQTIAQRQRNHIFIIVYTNDYWYHLPIRFRKFVSFKSWFYIRINKAPITLGNCSTTLKWYCFVPFILPILNNPLSFSSIIPSSGWILPVDVPFDVLWLYGFGWCAFEYVKPR